MRLSKISRSVLTDVTALLGVVVISLVALAANHIPLATNFAQLLAIELLGLAWPLSILAQEKRSHHKPVAGQQAISEILLFGLMAAVLAYTSFLFVFVRHSVGPIHIDTHNPLYLEAVTTAYTTLLICQLLNLLFIRADERRRVFDGHILTNPKLLRAIGLSVFIMLNIIYNPLLQGLFRSTAIGIGEWLSLLALAALYCGLRSAQRHTRQHSRQAVIELHHQVHKNR